MLNGLTQLEQSQFYVSMIKLITAMMLICRKNCLNYSYHMLMKVL